MTVLQSPSSSLKYTAYTGAQLQLFQQYQPHHPSSGLLWYLMCNPALLVLAEEVFS
jgi:hypothetical protein